MLYLCVAALRHRRLLWQLESYGSWRGLAEFRAYSCWSINVDLTTALLILLLPPVAVGEALQSFELKGLAELRV